jgi:hypothetical protein
MALPKRQVGEFSGVEIAREQTRRTIAFIAICSFFFVVGVIVLVGWLILKLQSDEVLKVLATTAGVLGGIVGAIVGFYFRSDN